MWGQVSTTNMYVIMGICNNLRDFLRLLMHLWSLDSHLKAIYGHLWLSNDSL